MYFSLCTPVKLTFCRVVPLFLIIIAQFFISEKCEVIPNFLLGFMRKKNSSYKEYSVVRYRLVWFSIACSQRLLFESDIKLCK